VRRRPNLVKQPPRPSLRQLTLLEPDVTIQLNEKVRAEVINALADLLLEALGNVRGESTEERNESED
jgi:hypothetical protein